MMMTELKTLQIRPTRLYILSAFMGMAFVVIAVLSWLAGVLLSNLVPMLVIAGVGVGLPILAKPTLAVTESGTVTYSQFGKVKQQLNLQKLTSCKYLFNLIGGLGIKGGYEVQMSHVWHLRDADGGSVTFSTIFFGNSKQLTALLAEAVAKQNVQVNKRTAKQLSLAGSMAGPSD